MDSPLRRWTFLPLVVLVCACADAHQVIRAPKPTAPSIARTESFYVSVPKDGAFGSQLYYRSGDMTTDTILAAFARKGVRAERGVALDTVSAGIEAARARNASFLIFPTILHWEDRATEWSGKPDKVEVKIDVVDARTGITFDTALITGTSGLATFGGDHPQDLLPEPIAGYVDDLIPGLPSARASSTMKPGRPPR